MLGCRRVRLLARCNRCLLVHYTVTPDVLARAKANYKLQKTELYAKHLIYPKLAYWETRVESVPYSPRPGRYLFDWISAKDLL